MRARRDLGSGLLAVLCNVIDSFLKPTCLLLVDSNGRLVGEPCAHNFQLQNVFVICGAPFGFAANLLKAKDFGDPLA